MDFEKEKTKLRLTAEARKAQSAYRRAYCDHMGRINRYYEGFLSLKTLQSSADELKTLEAIALVETEAVRLFRG